MHSNSRIQSDLRISDRDRDCLLEPGGLNSDLFDAGHLLPLPRTETAPIKSAESISNGRNSAHPERTRLPLCVLKQATHHRRFYKLLPEIAAGFNVEPTEGMNDALVRARI